MTVNESNWSEQLMKMMLEANRKGATALVERLLAEGMPPQSVLMEVLDPALVRVGECWGQAAISLSQGFVAAKIAEDTFLRCMPDKGEEGMPRKGAVVLGNIEDDFHSLGRRMVGSFLRVSGWEVHDLGNDVPPGQFVEKALEVRARVIGASAMMHTTALNIRKLRELLDGRGLAGRLKLAVGGAVFNWRPELVAEVGGDGTARNAMEADSLFARLQAEAGTEALP